MINSYAYRVDPTGTEKLGSSNSRDRYKECLPGVYEDTYVLEALTETTTIQHCGDFSLPLHQTVAHTYRAIRETEVRNYITLKKWPNNLTDTLVMSSLVGRKQLGFTHEPIEEFVERVRMEREGVMSIGPATIPSRYSVVAFEFSLLDIETGEVFDQLPQIISALLDELDLGCLVYKIGSYDFVALLNFGLPKSYDYAIKQLKQIARLINAKGSYKVSARNSSLFNVFPLPLSVTRDGVFCEILDVDVKDSISAIKQFLSFKPGAKETQSAPVVKYDSED